MSKISLLPFLILLFLLWGQVFVKASGNDPVCLEGVLFVMDKTSKEATIWASDLLQDTAGDEEMANVELRIWHPSFTANKPQVGDSGATVLNLPSTITFDCKDLGIQLIELYAIDTAGNWGFCLSNIEIQIDNNACETAVETLVGEKIAGHISTITGSPIENVALNLSSNEPGKATIFTNSSGYFEMKMPEKKDFVVRLEKAGNFLNGVSTFDIVLIAKHIIDDAPFTMPYQFIAADVNRSGTVTAFDMVELRRAILGLQTERFPNNTSWRFITKEDYYAGSNPLEQDFTENILLTDLDNPIGELAFFAVKIGDLNGNVTIRNKGLSSKDLHKMAEVIKITAKDRVVKQGETFELTLTSKSMQDLQSIQFSLFCKGLKVLTIEEGILKANHFATLGTNRVGVSWNGISTASIPEKEKALFTLQLKALENGQLSHLLSLSADIGEEVVNQEEELLNLELDFIANDPFKLFQNEPNPFAQETMIGFTIPENGLVTLEIFNFQGKLLKEIQGAYTKGYNEITINKQTLPENGVLLYQIRTDQRILTKKMIAIKE